MAVQKEKKLFHVGLTRVLTQVGFDIIYILMTGYALK